MKSIDQLIEKHMGERTFFDYELVGAFFTVQNLKNLCEDYATDKFEFCAIVMPLRDGNGAEFAGLNNEISSNLNSRTKLYCLRGETK